VAWLDLLLHGDPSSSPALQTVILSLLLGFVIGQVIGWIYQATHTAPSYSASFVGSIVALPVIVCLMMILMAGSLLITFGLLAVFAVVRFRNVLRDTRDTIYILWAIVEGMSVGTFRYSTALVGAACVALVLVYLRYTEFGVRQRFDAALSVLIPRDSLSARTDLEGILHRHSDRCILTNERQSPDEKDILSYRLLLRNPARRQELREDLGSIGDVQELSFYLQEDEPER
jgi:hypothetical protein